MSSITIKLPVTNAIPQSFNDHSRYKPLPILQECSSCDEGQAIECPECINDFAFQYMVEEGDIIPLQFRFLDDFNFNPLIPDFGWNTGNGQYWLGLTIITPAGEQAVSVNQIADQWLVGYNTQSIQNIQLNADKIKALIAPENCFALKIERCSTKYNYTIAVLCRTGDGQLPDGENVGDYALNFFSASQAALYQWNGASWDLAPMSIGQTLYCKNTGSWYNVVSQSGDDRYDLKGILPPSGNVDCDDTVDCFTHVYQFACNEPTVTFEGSFSGDFDCTGRNFALSDHFVGSSNFAHYEWFRVVGSIETIAFPLIQERNENQVLVKTTKRERAQVRTEGLPLIVADRVADVLTSDVTIIGGQEWEDVNEITRNNPDGLHWWLDFNVERELCILRPSCD